MKLPTRHHSALDAPISKVTQEAVPSLMGMWLPAARSPAKKSTTPQIQPPSYTTVHTCNGALHAATKTEADARMAVPIKMTVPSLLSVGNYLCAKREGNEPHYNFVEPRKVDRRP